MLKRILVTSLFLFTSLNASAAFIYADDFTVGQDVTQLTENATLHYLWGTGSSGESRVHQAGAFYHQHFGGITMSTTANTWPGIYLEAMGSPYIENYLALEVGFAAPVRSFGFKAENITSSPFALFLYDASGNFLTYMTSDVKSTGVRANESLNRMIYEADYTYHFDFDVGKIRLGGASDAGHIYALDVDVPEPSTLVLLFAGLCSIVVLRRVKAI